MTFQDQQLNSMTFQVFYDLYEPYSVITCTSDKQITP